MILILFEEMGMQNLTKKQRYWQAHLTALEEFDGNAAEYARLHGLEAKKLYVYKTKLRECAEQMETSPAPQEQPSPAPQERTSSQFVRITTATLSMRTGVTVWLPNDVRLSLPNLEAPGLLERLFRL